MTRIKLCGLQDPQLAPVLNELAVDYVGVILAHGFRRTVGLETAQALRAGLSERISLVGVFVNDSLERIIEVAKSGLLQAIQLHAQASEAAMNARIRAVQQATGLPVIQAYAVTSSEALDRAMRSPADKVMLDGPRAGAGVAFMPQDLSRMTRPYFLAGGLTAETVGPLLERWWPYAVDVSSAIETAGQKDPVKMRQFVNAVRDVKFH